jgi:hypothetical protein
MADPQAEVKQRPEMSPTELAESRKRGQTLFYGFAQCAKCHGDSALGDGQTTDYDEWTKEFIGDGKNTELVAAYENLGLLPPRNIRPRNLRLGVYRGGMPTRPLLADSQRHRRRAYACRQEHHAGRRLGPGDLRGIAALRIDQQPARCGARGREPARTAIDPSMLGRRGQARR